MNRKQDVMNLFNFLIDLLKENETTPAQQELKPKELLSEDAQSLIGVIGSPDKVLDMMKRVDEITKNDSVSKTVTGLREAVSKANTALRDAEIEILQKEKEEESRLETLPEVTSNDVSTVGLQ